MNEHTQLVMVLGISITVVLAGAGLIGYLLWVLFGEMRDYFDENRRRIKNADLHAHRITPQFTLRNPK